MLREQPAELLYSQRSAEQLAQTVLDGTQTASQATAVVDYALERALV